MGIGEDFLNTADMPSIVEAESGGDSSLTGEEVTVVKHLLGGWVNEVCPAFLKTLDIMWLSTTAFHNVSCNTD